MVIFHSYVKLPEGSCFNQPPQKKRLIAAKVILKAAQLSLIVMTCSDHDVTHKSDHVQLLDKMKYPPVMTNIAIEHHHF